MSNLKDLLKNYYKATKLVLTSSKKKQKIVGFKKQIWQSDEMANAFVKGSDASEAVAASLMDKEVNEIFLSECVAGNSVLDIGCGHGIVSIFLAQHGMKVTAIDISEQLLDKLRSSISDKNLSIEVKRGDAYDIPCRDNEFDVVVARMFLPHFPDWPKVLKEMTRVTKQGGKLIVHFHSRENTALGKKLAMHDCKFSSSEDITNPFNFSAETDDAELNKVSKQAGLLVNGRTPVSFFLHNRLIGYQLGTEAYGMYMSRMQEFLKDKKIEEFVLWFDKEVIANCSPAYSFSNVIHFEKK
jgi:ubiquinone/menaquinone biosynthesis C-methylase UbiE